MFRRPWRKSKEIEFPSSKSGKKRLKAALVALQRNGDSAEDCWLLGFHSLYNSFNKIEASESVFKYLSIEIYWNQMPAFNNATSVFSCMAPVFLRVVDCAASKKFAGHPSKELKLGLFGLWIFWCSGYLDHTYLTLRIYYTPIRQA